MQHQANIKSMKKYFSSYLNWRNAILFIIAFVTTFLLLCDSLNLIILLISKVGGIALACGFYHLFRFWDGKGYLKQLNELCKEED